MARKVLIVDDHQEFRQMLKLFIEKQMENVEIDEASTGEEGVDAAGRSNPGVALVDIWLPKMGGLETAQRIKGLVPECQIITMSMFEGSFEKPFVVDGIQMFIKKSEIDEKLIDLLNELFKKEKEIQRR